MPDRYSFLQSKHPVYEAQRKQWLVNLRRMLGGRYILSELVPFDWEKDRSDGSHYAMRQEQAVYHNYPDRFAAMMVGHMMRQAPQVDAALKFGTLGVVRRKEDIQIPTPAELLYYNTDGVGNDGSQWDNYWTQVGKRAVCFGHQWVLSEAPPQAPVTRQGELNGLRPYLSDYSPLSVPQWDYQYGRLGMAIIKRTVRRMRVDGQGALAGNRGEVEYLLMTRPGWEGFGAPFDEGGWFTFNAELEPTGFGKFTATGGEIPLAPLYYERIKLDAAEDEDALAATVSRSGITELGNAAIAAMNSESARRFDAWDMAQSVMAVLGADDKGFRVFINRLAQGTKYAPLPSPEDAPTKNPEVRDMSTGTQASEVFSKMEADHKQSVQELMLNEMQSAPYASGTSKRLTWTDSRAPRLSTFASEFENCQNAHIRWQEQLWNSEEYQTTRNASGSTTWRRDFDLLDPIEAGTAFFQMESTAGINSPTLDAKVMMLVAEGMGAIADDEEAETIRQELLTSAETKIERQEQDMELKKQMAEAKVAQSSRPPAGSAA